jgi:hypothetical protein
MGGRGSERRGTRKKLATVHAAIYRETFPRAKGLLTSGPDHCIGIKFESDLVIVSLSDFGNYTMHFYRFGSSAQSEIPIGNDHFAAGAWNRPAEKGFSMGSSAP